MHPSDFPAYWRKTRLRALIAVLSVLFAGLGLPVLASGLGTTMILGFPLTYFAAAFLSLAFFVAILIWLVHAQRRIEQQFDVVRDD